MYDHPVSFLEEYIWSGKSDLCAGVICVNWFGFPFQDCVVWTGQDRETGIICFPVDVHCGCVSMKLK